MNDINRLIISLSVIFCLLPIPESLKAQQHPNTPLDDISVTFMKDTVNLPPRKFGLNSLIIRNQSESEVRLNITVKIPDAFESVSKIPNKIVLPSGKEEVFPLRLVGSGREIGGQSYPVEVILSDEAQHITSTSYILLPEVVSDWRVAVAESPLFFPAENENTEVGIRFQNIGNTKEHIKIEPKTVPEAFKFEADSFEVTLEPGIDTVIYLKTSFKMKEYKGPDDIAMLYVTNKEKPQKLRVLTQDFMPSAQEIREHRHRWFYTEIEANLYYQTLPTDGGFLFANLSGSVPLRKNRSIRYNWRSNFNMGSSSSTGTNQFFNADYRSKRLRLRIGDQSDFYERIITGFGLKTELVLPKNEFEVLGVKDRIRNTGNFHGKYTFKPVKNMGITAYTNFEEDSERQVNTTLQSLRYEHKIGKKTRLEARLGYGTENFEARAGNRKLEGLSFTANLDAETKKYRYQFRNFYSSSFFPGRLRGITTLIARINKKSGDWFYGPVFTRSKNNPKFFEDENIREELFTDSRLFEFEAGIRRRGLFLTVAPGYSTDNQDNFAASFYGLRLNTLWQARNGFGVGASSTLGSWQLKDTQGPSLFRHNTSLNLSYKGYGIDATFREGPFFINELDRFSADTALSETFIALYMRKGLFREKLQAFFRAEYNTGSDFNEAYILSGDLEYQLTRDFSVRFNSVFNSNYLNRKVTFAAGIRKKFKLPLIGMSRYKQLTVVMFKDADGDGRFDKSEEPISNAALKVGEVYLQTDASGRAVYKNIEPKIYDIDLTPVSVIDGWYFPRGRIQQVIVNKNTEYLVPFERSRVITGKIEMEKTKYSKYNYSLGGIRITAVDSAGRVQGTFTEDDGSFRMDLPGGTWKITFNTSVLGDKFDIITDEVTADLMNNKSLEVLFRVREKKRKLNIKEKK